MIPIDAELWPRLILVALVIVCVYVALRPRYAWRIVVEDGRVKSHQGVAKAQVPRVVHFLEKDVAADTKYTVLGGRDRSGVVRVNFRGEIDVGRRQQIRNYLKMIL
jgi:hypothetical protein